MAIMAMLPLLLMTEQANASRLTCKTDKPFIQVHPITKPVQYVRNVSSRELTNSRSELLGGGHFIGGTGGGTIGLEADIRYETKRLGRSGCMSIKSIKGTFYAKPVIHIASDFPRGSCEYNAILEHEKKHIRVMKRFHKKYAPKIKKELRKLARELQSNGPIPSADIDITQQRVHRRILQHIRNYSDGIMEQLDRQQSYIDTPEEYARVDKKCKGWSRVRLNLPKRSNYNE